MIRQVRTISIVLFLVLFVNGRPETCPAKDEIIVRDYIESHSDASGSYRIQGWRWHTLSVLREIKLVIASVESSSDLEALIQYVIGFNLRGLHEVEEVLFYPWLKAKLSLIPEEDARISFQRLLGILLQNQSYLAGLGREVTDNFSEEQLNHEDLQVRLELMVTVLKEICRLQNEFVSPAVALLVPEREQSSFNTKIIRKLGILDSRLYLVGMYEAASNDDDELLLFKQEIPSIPQYFLPRWKRLLYDTRFTNLL